LIVLLESKTTRVSSFLPLISSNEISVRQRRKETFLNLLNEREQSLKLNFAEFSEET